jgi:anaerobic selenocysteine-containing dehydrogenase
MVRVTFRRGEADVTEPSTTTAHRICPLCEACCGLELTVTGGRVTAVRGHEADVFSRGYVCPKAVALKDLHEDPDRLRTPLVKRDGRFVPATWDEAFAEIERRLVPIQQQHGRDAVAVVFGNPSVHKAGLILYVARLARAFSTRNLYSASTIDQMPKQLASGLMFGEWLSIPVPDIERTDLLVILGANPAVSNGSLWTVPDFRGKARALRARGGRIVVIDPRRTETAELADEFHFIRPGADAFLLAGIVHTLFDERLVRLGRLAAHVDGFDALAPAFAPFAPERVAARCGIEANAIRALARALAQAQRAAVYGRLGTCTQEFGTATSWLVDLVNVLTGHLDQPGGAMFARAAAFAKNTQGAPGRGRGVATGRHRSRVAGAPEVFGELPLTCLAEEIETAGAGQVRALVTIAGNPVLSAPNGARLGAALAQLEFMVSVDVYLNETTRFADVILPGSSPLEELHFDTAFPQFGYRNTVRASAPVLPRDADHPPEWQVLLRLAAIAMGRGAGTDLAAFDDELAGADVQRVAGDHAAAVMQAVAHLRGPERLIDLALRAGPYGDRFGLNPQGLTLQKVLAAPGGIDLGALAPRVPEVLRTPSGKIELAPAGLLQELARAAARLAEPASDLVIVGRRQVRSNNSWMHNLPTLAKGRNRCTLLMHPADARRFGLVDGGRARIAGKRPGAPAIEAQVEVSDAMMPGVISLPHGWGHDQAGAQLGVAAVQPGANLNAVLDETLRDPLSGNAVLSGVAVALSAA